MERSVPFFYNQYSYIYHQITFVNHLPIFQMKNFLFLLVLLLSTSLSAINPSTDSMSDRFETSSDEIDTELSQLHEMNQLVLDNGYNFETLNANHTTLVTTSKLSSSARAGIFDGHPDNPAGIPGFWWGFCCWIGGMIVVYLTMDEGSGRKEQVTNALYGCIATTVLWTVVNLLTSILLNN